MIRDAPVAMDGRVEQIETALIDYLKKGHQSALSLSATEKAQWEIFRRMADGLVERDNPADVLAEIGFYQPIIDKAREMFKAQMINSLVPDPAKMDFFAGLAKWSGLEDWAESITQMMREKFKVMRAEGIDGGFIDVLDAQVDDLTLTGNCVGIMIHEATFNDHDDNPTIQSGPTLTPISPENIWPWRTDVGSFAQTAVTIYQPISREDLENPENGYQNVEEVVGVDPQATTTQDPAAGKSWEGAGGPLESELYERHVYFGPWPEQALRKALAAGTDDGVLWDRLSEQYQIDVDRAMTAYWWQMEYIGEHLIQCRPFPLDLPRGMGPLIHHKFIPRNGYIWGKGLYHRCAWDERLINHFKRQMIVIAASCADPPFTYRKHLVDQEYLAAHGGQVRLTSGEGIVTIPDPSGGRIVEPILFNAESIPIMEAIAERGTQDVREITGVTSAVEGTDRSRTATQSSNNLQQSLSLEKYHEKRFEQGYLRQCVARAYVIQAQAMRLSGMSEHAPMSQEQGQLRMATVSPEMLIGETLIDWQMTGLTSPGNKMNLIQLFQVYAQAYLGSGMANAQELFTYWGKLLGIGGAERFAAQGYDMMGLQRMMANLATAFGPAGAMLLPDQAKQAMQQMMGSMMGGMGPPMGPGNGPGAPGMPPAGPPLPAPGGPTGPAGMPLMGI